MRLKQTEHVKQGLCGQVSLGPKPNCFTKGCGFGKVTNFSGPPFSQLGIIIVLTSWDY